MQAANLDSGKATAVDLLEVRWPTTQNVENFTRTEANQIVTIKEGAGIIKTERYAAPLEPAASSELPLHTLAFHQSPA